MIALPQHPLDHPDTVKILLGRTASELIAAHGDQFFAMVLRPDCTAPPEANGRMILHVMALEKERAHAALRVALGQAKAVKIRTSSKTEK